MKKRNTDVKQAIAEIVSIIKSSDDNAEEKILLFDSVLQRLPRIVLVDSDSKPDAHIFSGIIQLYSPAKFIYLSGEERSEKEISFAFSVDDKALIYKRSINAGLIFAGSWIDVLQKIVETISLLEFDLSEKERNAMEAFLKELA